MTIIATIARTRIAGRPLSAWRWALRSKAQHLRRAWRYFRGTLTRDDAFWIISDCERVAGLYGLEHINAENVLEQARDRWGENPALADLVDEAVARVGSKWSSSGHVTDAAEDWAFDLIEEYAERDGIELVEVDA